MVNVAIVGARGYAGRELIRLCLRHPEIKIVSLTGTLEKPEPVSEVFPEFRHLGGMKVEPLDAADVAAKADLVFLALPHKVSQEHAGSFARAGKRVIDLSADFRFNDIDTYEKTYAVPHQERELAGGAVYGLAEIYRDQIRDASLIGVPGCYPTGALLGILPVVMSGIEVVSPIIVDSKSGVSGAGKKPSSRAHFPECNESVQAYNVGMHRHQPEIQEKVAMNKPAAGPEIDVIFTPHLIPMTRGILSTIYLGFSRDVAGEEIRAAYESRYRDETFVRLPGSGVYPATGDVAYTNFCDIGWKQISPRRLIVITAIDNLVKGASGQALQCFNISYGFPESMGLM